MKTRRQFKVWGLAFALLVVGLFAALPVWADPGIRLGSPDAPATGYADFTAPAALPATGAQPSTRPHHTIFELRQVETDLAGPGTLPATGAQTPARPYHSLFELRQFEQGLAAPATMPATGSQSSTRPWVTVGQIPREQVTARVSHSTFELRQVEAGF